MSSENEGTLVISLMPMELMLMITCILPPSSRASLVFICKRFGNVISRRVATLLLSVDDLERLYLGIWRKLSQNFEELTMSDPQLFKLEKMRISSATREIFWINHCSTLIHVIRL